jgi:hypothetical protein
MKNWHNSLELSRPFWGDYRARLRELDDGEFPLAGKLNKLLPAKLRSHGGKLIRFVPAGDLPALQYEHHIYTHGEVSTRENSWHDLFNALVWSRFPRLKVAMNARHYSESKADHGPSRGKQRDALTLLDESGAIVVSSDKKLLKALARHQWSSVFLADAFQPDAMAGRPKIEVFLCGHALLEKFLQPYKAITAQVLLLQVDGEQTNRPRETFIESLDDALSRALMDSRILRSTSSLSPLPLMGIPGWWPGGVQDESFYADQKVFRPLHSKEQKAPILDWLF